MNTGYRAPEEVRALLGRLTGKPVDESVAVFPPSYSEFGKNLPLGKDVFVNIGCSFQDTGGITIGDGTLIGHGSTLTTLNHGTEPDRRPDMTPAPVVIGRNVWLGATDASARWLGRWRRAPGSRTRLARRARQACASTSS